MAIVITTNAQYRPVTIPQLKELIGYNKSEVKKILRKKSYFLAEEESDNKDGHPHEYYSDSTFDTEIEIIYINKVSRVAGFEGISNDEYKTLVEWLKANKFYLKTKGNIGTERNDIWEDNNEDWKMVANYRTWPEFKILKVTLYEVK